MDKQELIDRLADSIRYAKSTLDASQTSIVNPLLASFRAIMDLPTDKSAVLSQEQVVMFKYMAIVLVAQMQIVESSFLLDYLKLYQGEGIPDPSDDELTRVSLERIQAISEILGMDDERT